MFERRSSSVGGGGEQARPVGGPECLVLREGGDQHRLQKYRGGEVRTGLGWPTFGLNRLGLSVYGPYPPCYCSGVSVPVCVAVGRLLWWWWWREVLGAA